MEQGDICDDPNWTSIRGDWSIDKGVNKADGLKFPSPLRPSESLGDPPRRCGWETLE